MKLTPPVLSLVTMKSRFLGVVIGCISMLPIFAFAPAANANLVTNGSFETLNTPLGVNGICTTDSIYPYSACSATGWTSNYQIGKGATIGRAGVSFGIPQPDLDGTNALIIQSYHSEVFPSATETVDIPVAGEYTLSFYAANRSNVDNGPQTLSVLWDNTAITGGIYRHLGAGWSLETLTFNADAGTNTLTFAGLTTEPGDVSAFVDNVSLLPAGTASVAPEPSSFALMAFIGISTGLGLARKRFTR